MVELLGGRVDVFMLVSGVRMKSPISCVYGRRVT
jgi:hypothetical protein